MYRTERSLPEDYELGSLGCDPRHNSTQLADYRRVCVICSAQKDPYFRADPLQRMIDAQAESK